MIELLEYLVKRVDSIDKKVEEVLKFKWQVMGGALVLNVIFMFIFQYLIFHYREIP